MAAARMLFLLLVITGTSAATIAADENSTSPVAPNPDSPPAPLESNSSSADPETSPASDAASRKETLAQRELREVVNRERAVWERLRARPDDPAVKARADAELRDVITAYENVIRRSPDFAEAYANYGLLLSRTGNRELATLTFLRANKLNPNIPMVKNQIGNFLVEEGNYKEALPYYLAAIELAPNEPLYHYQLGSLMREFREFFIADGIFSRATLDEKIQVAFRRAAELGPDTWGYIYRYAESFYDVEQPDWEAALAEWRKLESKARPGVEMQTVRLHIARVLVELERRDEARAILNTIDEPVLAENRQTVVELLSANREE